MKCVYISSTVEDLRDYRLAVTDALRKVDYSVEGMENYPARDDQPRRASEADAAKSDYYVGIFAWRYGYVPREGNPAGKSITELEYLAAERVERPRFIFLLSDQAPWSSSYRDAEQEEDAGKRIRELRNRLKTDRWAAFFTTPDDLAKNVLISIFRHEATRRSETLSALDEVQSAAEFGASGLPNIQAKLEAPGSADFVSLCLGSPFWWNTRLHLAAALASDFTEIRQFVLIDAEMSFLMMSTPGEIRRAVAKSNPRLEIAYLESRKRAPGSINAIVQDYPGAIRLVLGSDEISAKQIVDRRFLQELGIRQDGEMIDQTAAEGPPAAEIVRRKAPFIALTKNGRLEGIVDRVQLASRMARSAFPS